MSTHELKLQQSARQSGERASVACVASNQDRFYTRTDKARSQNVSGHEKLHPGPSAQHNKKESECGTTATSPSQHFTGQQKSSRDVQIRQIILLRPNKNTSKISEDQSESSRFTTVISISLPTKRNKTVQDTEETLQNDTDLDNTHETVKKTTNQHHTEQRDKFSTTDTCSELFKDGDGSKAPFDEGSFSTLQSQHGLNTPNQGRDTGVQHNLDLHGQTQIAYNDSQRRSTQPVCVIQTAFSKGTNANKESGASDHIENAPTTPQNHSNLTSHEKDSSLKASTDCELLACRSEVLSQVLSLASFHTPLSGSTSEPEQSLLNPASTMLASALASVLAPPWSGRLRRSKQGGSEVEHEPQDYGHNVNPSTSLQQDRRQQPFLASQRQQAEHVLQDSKDNDMQFTARTSYSSADWQKENNSPNITTTIQSKRAIMKSSSGDRYRAMMYNSAEPLDSGQVPRLPHSEECRGYRMSKTEDQNEPFKSLSSKPTTSSLLLSLRRANLRRSNAETTQMQTQTNRSIRSLTLPSRSILKSAKTYTSSVTPDDQAEDTLGSFSFTNTPSGTEGILDTSNFPFSPRSKRIVTRTPLFPNKTDTETSKIPEAFVARDDKQQFPNSTTKSSPHEIFKAKQDSHSLILRNYSNTEDGDPVELSTARNTNQQNSNINNNPDTFSQNSPKDKTNLNKDFPQTGFNVRNIKSQRTQITPDSNHMSTRSFTDRLNISPKKESFSVDEINTTNQEEIYLDSKKSSQSSQSPMDLSSPLSPSRPTRGFRVPSIYSYLRESSPAVYTPNTPSTSSSQIQRVENSSSPLQGGGEILQGDKKTPPSRFSFDISPVEPQAQAFKIGSFSSLIGPAQSLPPDFGRKSAPRLSTSPYSTLISSRPALNSTLLSSPPASKPHYQSTSNDTLTIRVYPIKGDSNASPSMYKSITKRPKEQLGSPDREQRTANTVQDFSCALDNHKPAQPCLIQTAPDASFVMESQSTNITPHPRQNTGSHEEHDGLIVQLNKGNSYSKHRLSQKENTVTAESETLLTAEKEITDLHTRERLQDIPNSKKGFFALRVKKDTSDPVADKDDVTPQYLKTKRNLPVLKTSSRIDQMLNRLKQTFGGKRSDNSVDTKNDKTTTQQPLDTETFERAKREEKKCSESQWEPSLINDKASFTSLSPSTLIKSENILNVDVQNRVKSEKKHFGSQWEAPHSSLTTAKACLPSLESLSPLTYRKYENTPNVDRQNRVEGEKQRFGSQWEVPDLSLTTDKASLPSLESLSPFTLSKSEKTLNVDQQKRWSDENGKQSYSSSPHRLKTHVMNRSATLPHYRNSVGPPSPFYLFDCDLEDIQNDNVFYSPVSKKSNSLCESDNSPQLSSTKSTVHQNLIRSRLSLSCADLKYGLNNGRSFSVSSVVSSRPSGPGRISTSSISDLSSIEDFMPRGKYSRFDSPVNISYSPTYGAKSPNNQSQTGCTLSDDHLQNSDKQENSCFWDDADPTPPPSPTFSPSSRRISQAPSASSPIWTSPDSPSRGILPSRSYSTSLTVFEESSSDTTTDDEYYLDNGDEIETEL